ncbi:MAG TPA: hypothetical protein VHM31_23025 [Polyangia bacterium]|nr:hypothetical protein [Polyangia bacterium]HVY40838.1 hypothetical protein [Polyangia bacterium]
MTTLSMVLCAALLAADTTPPAQAPSSGAAEQEEAETAKEPAGGEGVSPVELIPRLELRQAFTKLESGTTVHDTILELDIQFLRRVLLRYQSPARIITTPMGQVAGLGDIQFGLVVIVWSTPRFVAAALAGAELNSATQPALGSGKLQPTLGLGAAFKPYRWWLAYAVAQQQFSVAGASDRPDTNQLATDVGSILFGKDFNWLKLDVQATVDFPGGAVGRVYGLAEVGSLVIGRVGLFARVGTQLGGPAYMDYTLAAGFRYLFRLEVARTRPNTPGQI